MVKTTINLESEIYQELVKEAVEKYGTTKTLSRIINEKLRSRKKAATDIVKKTAGLWKIKESGYEYTRNLRNEWKNRMKAIE